MPGSIRLKFSVQILNPLRISGMCWRRLYTVVWLFHHKHKIWVKNSCNFGCLSPTTVQTKSLYVLLMHAWVLSGYSAFLPQSKNRHIKIIGDFKLTWSSECERAWIVLALWWTGRLSRMFPTSRPMSAAIGSSLSVTLNWIKRKWKMDGWSQALWF